MKVSVQVEYYLDEYNNYCILLKNKLHNYNVENFDTYYIYKNINKTTEINFRFINTYIDTNLNINFTNYIKDIDNLQYIKKYYNNFNLYILVGDYFECNITFDKIIKKINNKKLIKYINYIFKNKLLATESTNFRHCDFKINNILIKNNKEASIFDLDFSVFVKDTEFIKIERDDYPVVNLYLNLGINKQISGNFLRLFDIYLFALSIIYQTNKYQIENIKNYLDDNINSYNYCSDFYIFYIIYSNIILNLPNEFTTQIYYEFATYNYILKILNNYKKIIIDTNIIHNPNIINGFNFIQDTILTNILINKYL
jgi:hypothetical protein